jgi:hypothetical protein
MFVEPLLETIEAVIVKGVMEFWFENGAEAGRMGPT